MKQKSFFFLRVPVLCVAVLLLTAAASVFRAFRMVWVFYDPNLRFLGGAAGLFLITVAVLGLLLVLLALRVWKPQSETIARSRVCRALAAFGVVFALLFALAAAVMIYIAGHETGSVMLLWLKKDLPLIFGFLAFAVLLVFLPNCKGRGKAALAVCMALVFALGALWIVFPVMPYRIVSDPVVMDTGEDYAVVFATNTQGTGFVTYSFDGTDYTVYAQTDGRRIGDRLMHAVHVPYVHLKNNRYSVGSTRVVEEFSYGGRMGKTVTAGPYTLQVNESDAQTYLVVSDWHSYLDDAKKAIFHLGDYDAVILLGDPAAGMDFEEQAVRNIVQFGGALTGGEIPVLYVRGNHETRGAFADQLPSYLGYDKLYYTADRGPYSFLVLDSGEDKPDDHVEYGGMDDYRLNREQMLDWLKTVKVKNDKLIVLSHAWQVSEPEPALSRAAWDAFSRLGARFVISGHEHTCRFLDGADEEEKEYLDAYPGITVYLDGGHKGKTYIASKLTLTPQGVHLEAVSNTGEPVIDKTLPW